MEWNQVRTQQATPDLEEWTGVTTLKYPERSSLNDLREHRQPTTGREARGRRSYRDQVGGEEGSESPEIVWATGRAESRDEVGRDGLRGLRCARDLVRQVESVHNFGFMREQDAYDTWDYSGRPTANASSWPPSPATVPSGSSGEGVDAVGETGETPVE